MDNKEEIRQSFIKIVKLQSEMTNIQLEINNEMAKLVPMCVSGNPQTMEDWRRNIEVPYTEDDYPWIDTSKEDKVKEEFNKKPHLRTSTMDGGIKNY